jgi:hypothetical protein
LAPLSVVWCVSATYSTEDGCNTMKYLEAVGLKRQADRNGMRRHSGNGHVVEYHPKTGRWAHYKGGNTIGEGTDHTSMAEHIDKHFYAGHGPAGADTPSQHSELTENEGRGYHGEMWSQHQDNAKAHKAYNDMHARVMKESGASHEEAKHFLDSIAGRHLAGNEHNLKQHHQRWKKTYNPADYKSESQHSEEDLKDTRPLNTQHVTEERARELVAGNQFVSQHAEAKDPERAINNYGYHPKASDSKNVRYDHDEGHTITFTRGSGGWSHSDKKSNKQTTGTGFASLMSHLKKTHDVSQHAEDDMMREYMTGFEHGYRGHAQKSKNKHYINGHGMGADKAGEDHHEMGSKQEFDGADAYDSWKHYNTR